MTDHGLLLLEEIGEHEKIRVAYVPVVDTKSRYVVGRQVGHTDKLSFRVPKSPESDPIEAWFARGVGCFRTRGPYNYVHGGLSLQELVVPHLPVEQKVMRRAVKLEAASPDLIRNARPLSSVLSAAARLTSQDR